MENGKKQYQTAGRTALLAYLKRETTETPQTADEIYRGVTAMEHAPGRSSVYRMLGEFAADGTVRKYQAEGGGSVYQFVGEHADCGGHLHLQCISCGRVSHLKCDCSVEISLHLMKTHGFLVDSGRSVLYGTCSMCAGGGEDNA
ncbi:MAG: transcriptional repressor [Clostridia bacterium]|nr:transcriptional repressor [Clostridia bacterium]MBQ3056573.1 transcriptional repressor [Clostridia bacterium]